MNTRKLKAKCVERGITISELCENIGISNATLYRRMEKNTLTINDAMAISNVLCLDSDDILSIFLPQQSQI